MNVFQDDKQVVVEGRKNKLKDAKLSLRDQISKKLKKSLDEMDIGQHVVTAWDTASNDITPVLQRQQAFLEDLDNFTNEVGDDLEGGNSSIHLPAAFIVCKTYHARFLDALMGIDPPFSVKPRREDGTDRVKVVEDLMRYTLQTWCNNYQGIEEQVDSWIWNWCTTGTGILKMRWNTLYDRYQDVVQVPVELPPIYRTEPDGTLVAVPQFDVEEREQDVTKKIFSGPQYDLVQFEDYRTRGGGGDPDLADIVMHRSYYTASELWIKVDQGVFDEEAVAAVIEAGRDSETSTDESGLKQQRKAIGGQADMDSQVLLDRYEICEAILRLDVDGSGINSDIVVWVSLKKASVLGCTYLRRIMPTGERPYAVVHFHKRPGDDYGLGLLEILNPITVELDAMHSVRMDAAMMQTLPPFFYRPSQSLNPETIQLEPGMGIPVDDPARDVYFPPISNRTVFSSQEEGFLQSYIERLTGISDLSLGVMTGTQGATRTASGVRALMGENNNNLSVHLRRLNRGWLKVLRYTFHMLRNRVEPGFSFRITGEDGADVFREIFDTDLAMEVDFELSANTANTNKSVQIEVSQQLIGITMNPLNIQLGITGPTEAYNAQKLFLQNLGIKDIHRYLKRPQGYDYVLPPAEEFNRVIRGQAVPVAPNADHNGFLAFAQAMLDSQQEARTLNQEQEAALIDQMKAHAEMQAALEQQQAQQAVAAQMQAAAAMSGMQAPTTNATGTGGSPDQLFTTNV